MRFHTKTKVQADIPDALTDSSEAAYTILRSGCTPATERTADAAGTKPLPRFLPEKQLPTGAAGRSFYVLFFRP